MFLLQSFAVNVPGVSEIILLAEELCELFFSIYCVLLAYVVWFCLKGKEGGRDGVAIHSDACRIRMYNECMDSRCGVRCALLFEKYVVRTVHLFSSI